MLDRRETEVIERLLGGRIASTALVWDRAHVVRVVLDDGRSAIVKRPRDDTDAAAAFFAAEGDGLRVLAGAPFDVAPRLLGEDRGVLVLEELPEGRSLADSLLGGDAAVARDDLSTYARALASVHRWSIDRRDLVPTRASWWIVGAKSQRDRFLRRLADLGIDVAGVDGDVDVALATLDGAVHAGFVHGDPCPDNVRLLPDRCVLFDFERSSSGAVVLDAMYLLAPFPSCWCFGVLPDDAAASAMDAYVDVLDPGESWAAEMAAALAIGTVWRAPMLTAAMRDDFDWGTTTARARLLRWSASFGEHATLPNLSRAIADVAVALSTRWTDVVEPGYPCFTGS